jgi:anaphase-promoting complex subunit 8
MQLMEELEQAYMEQSLDSFGLYVYGLVLKEAQMDNLTCIRPPHTILVESILQFPYNWSAWLDLAEVLVQGGSSTTNNGGDSSTAVLEQQVEQALQPTLATHYMYHFFCAHLMSHHHQAHEDALVLYDRLYEPLPDQILFQTAYLKSQMGVVHYHLREFEQALEWFHQIQDPFLLEHKDVYSNILYVREDRVALSQLAHQAVRVDKYRPETCCIIGNYYSLKQKRTKAVLYFQRALKLDRNYTSAWTLMGHEYVELKQTESAMEAYRRAVNVSPKDYRAWYGLGQTYEFLNMHLYALFYYRKAAMLRPYDARMWCAVGLCFVALHKIPDAIRAYERAVAQEDTEGIATQKLATLYRQEGRMEEAAQCYLRHLELRYLVTSSSDTSNAAPPTLDAIIHGVVVEAPEAEAMVYLAQYHKSHGEYDTAALMCSRLVEYPGPEKEQAKGLLRDLRSRGRRFTTSTAPSSSSHAAAAAAAEAGTNDDNDHAKSAFEFSP